MWQQLQPPLGKGLDLADRCLLDRAVPYVEDPSKDTRQMHFTIDAMII